MRTQGCSFHFSNWETTFLWQNACCDEITGHPKSAIPKICELLRKWRSLLDFAIRSVIAESQNPGGTDLCSKQHVKVNFDPFNLTAWIIKKITQILVCSSNREIAWLLKIWNIFEKSCRVNMNLFVYCIDYRRKKIIQKSNFVFCVYQVEDE